MRRLVYIPAWGCISLPFLQRVAALACRDIDAVIAVGKEFNDIESLSGLGNDGTYPGTMCPEMRRALTRMQLAAP